MVQRIDDVVQTTNQDSAQLKRKLLSLSCLVKQAHDLTAQPSDLLFVRDRALASYVVQVRSGHTQVTQQIILDVTVGIGARG